MEISSEVYSLLADCVNIRQSLHMMPETGFEEFKTSSFIKSELKATEPDSLETLAGTGLKAVYYSAGASETVAFRADIDALDIEEQNDIRYKSVHRGKMHACGHDGHICVLILLAKLLHKNRNHLKYNVVLLFQPAEEGKGGANRMISEGAMENPVVDRIYGLHLWPDLPKGKFGMRWGPLMARACEFDIEVQGLSAHGATPQNGVDAIVAASTLVMLLQTAISRDIDPHKDALLTIGKISGGFARNIIADNVVMNATLRVFEQEVYDRLMQRIHSMVDGLEVAMGASFDIKELMHYPCVNNPRDMVVDFYRYLEPEDIVLVEPALTAEDFSCYQEKTRGLFFFLGIGGGKNYAPLHANCFDFDEDALLYAVEAYSKLLDFRL